MELNKIIIIALSLVLLNCGANPVKTVDNVNNIDEWSTVDRDLFYRIQKYRDSLELPKMIPSKDMHVVVVERLEDMKGLGGISHEGVGIYFQKLFDLGYTGLYEILGYGYYDNSSVVKAWKKSESHNKVLTDSSSIYVGLHVLDYNGKKFYVLFSSKK